MSTRIAFASFASSRLFLGKKLLSPDAALTFRAHRLLLRAQTSNHVRTIASGSFNGTKIKEDLPSSYQKILVQRQSPNIDDAVEIVTVPMQAPQNGEVIVQNRYVGINAKDINICAGRYLPMGNPPYELGFEGVGTVVAVGNEVSSLRIGMPVSYTVMKAYSEYVCLPAKEVLPIPEVKPEYVGLLFSGLTAAISLDKKGRIKNGETVLITAASGGAGHIAVQWAKHAGCHVIGLCSSAEKAVLLKNGVDVIWESFGGKMFEDLFTKLANRGRMVCVGSITGYQSDQAIPRVDVGNLPEMLMYKSLNVCGFFLPHYQEEFSAYLGKLITMMKQGNLTVYLDNGKKTPEGEFVGLKGIIRAIRYLHSGKNVGKVIARLS